jgi:aspartate kinase
MEGHIPLRIRATGSAQSGYIGQRCGGQVEIRGDRVVTGIAHVGGWSRFSWKRQPTLTKSELGLAIFRCLAEAGISLDMIYVSPRRISFIIEHRWSKQAEEVLREFPVKVQIESGMAKVSAVGAGMRGVPGVMARVVSALQRAGVNIYQTTDSHANISCLVREKDVEAAVHALHSEFQLGRSET